MDRGVPSRLSIFLIFFVAIGVFRSAIGASDPVCPKYLAAPEGTEAALSERELAAIRLYTGGGYLYLNGFLRGKSLRRISDHSRLVATTRKAVLADIEALSAALGKLPSESGRFHRFLGIGLGYGSSMDGVYTRELRAFLRKHAVGTTFVDPAFVSTTKRTDVKGISTSINYTIEIEIEALHAKSIARYSQEPNEEEYLLPRGTSFRVENVVGGFIPNDNPIGVRVLRQHWMKFFRDARKYGVPFAETEAEAAAMLEKTMVPRIRIELREIPVPGR